jgi:hypothetical protein
MTNLDVAIRVLARHEGGWRNNGKPDIAECWGCGYKPQLGEYHGTHVAKDLLAVLGVPENG